MEAASRVASRWVSAEGMPILHRSPGPPIALEDSRDLKKLEAMIGKNGLVNHAEYFKAKLHKVYVAHAGMMTTSWTRDNTHSRLSNVSSSISSLTYLHDQIVFFGWVKEGIPTDFF